MKKYCVSLELAKEMKALGFEQKGNFWWCPVPTHGNHYLLLMKGNTGIMTHHRISAYTVGELGEMLPMEILDGRKGCYLAISKEKEGYVIEYNAYFPNEISLQRRANTEADARAKMLIYLKKEGII